MNRLLLLISVFVFLLCTGQTTKGQTIILTENFTGFNVGSHTTPSTSDVSSSLDQRTSVPGWSGSLIYPAGGEIKIGTSSTTGWIETPSLDLSQNGGSFSVSFALARWPGDATTVQVYLNGAPIGNVLSPGDDFQEIRINNTDGTSSSKIRILGLTKRFYIDNFSIEAGSLTTSVTSASQCSDNIKIYPVPAGDELIISGIGGYHTVEIFDITGRSVLKAGTGNMESMTLHLEELNRGLFFVRLISGTNMKLLRFVRR